jgi:hypothetical protein
MSKIKFVQNKVYNYVKGKSVIQVVADVVAFGFLLPLAVMGITFMSYQVMFNGVTI